MKVLVTGGLGRVGSMVVEEALRQGFQVRATDLKTDKTAALAERFRAQGVELILGDLLDTNFLKTLVNDVDAILHNAAILPPHTETKPEFARKVNVGITQTIVDLIETMPKKPRLIFLSTFTVFGKAMSDDSLVAIDDEPNPDTEYTRNKVECEKMLRASSIPFVILRLGAAIDARESDSADKEQLRLGLQISANSPEHWVHPKDVARAQCHAAVSEEALGRTFHIGGDDSCRVSHYELVAAAVNAAGLTLSRDVFGKERFNGHFMDTRESQRVLQFQTYTFDAYRKEYAEKFKTVRIFTKPLSFIISPITNWYFKHML